MTSQGTINYLNGTTRVQNLPFLAPTDPLKKLEQDYRKLEGEKNSVKNQRDALCTMLRQSDAVNAQTDTQLLDKIRGEKVNGFEKTISLFNFMLIVLQKKSAWNAGSITRELDRLAADAVDTFFPGQDRKMREDRLGKLTRAAQNIMSNAMIW